MKRKFTKLIAALALLVFMTPTMAGWGQTTLKTSDLDWGTPVLSENFDELDEVTNSGNSNSNSTTTYTNLTAYGIFNKISIGKKAAHEYAIVDDDDFDSNIYRLTSKGTSYFIASITGHAEDFGSTGAYSIKVGKSDYGYFGLYAEDNGDGMAHAKASVFIRINNGALHISDGGTTSTKWISIGTYTTDTISINVVYNNTDDATFYGDEIALNAKTAHVFVNGVCVMDGSNPKNYTIPGAALTVFRCYPQNTNNSVFRMDDVMIYNTLPTVASTDPSISADNVNIPYNAISGSIAYTINNPVEGGAITSATVTASEPSGWLTVNGSNSFSSPIDLTCEANTVASEKTATVQLTYTYNTNQTVTKDVTVTQAAVPTYTVTYDGNGSTDGSVVDSDSPYLINSTVTVLGEGNLVKTGYSFVEWNTDAEGNGTSYDSDDTFIITENTTLYAQWLINEFNFTLNVIGDDINADAELRVDNQAVATGSKIEYGKIVTVYVVVSEGYEYTVSVMAGNIAVPFANNTFTMPDNNVTVTVNTILDPYSYTSLTGDDMSSMTNVGTSYNTIKSITTLDGFYWETNGYQAGGTSNPQVLNIIQLRIRTNSNGVSYIKLPEFNGKIEGIVFSVTEATATSYSAGGVYKGVLGFQESNKKDAAVIKQGGDGSNGMKTITLDLSDVFYTTGFIVVYSGNAVRIWNIDVTYLPYSDMEGTTLSSLANNVAVSIPSNTTATSENLTIPASSGILIKSGASLAVTGTLTNSGTAANLVIEDGGQLITSNAVNATMKKEITAASGWGEQDPSNPYTPDGWYFIASPNTTANLKADDVIGMITPNETSGENTIRTFDLFRYNPNENLEWENYWQHNATSSPFTIENGKGYLYASKNGTKIEFNSAIKGYDAQTNTVTVSAGWNLIGNPYTFAAFIDKPYYSLNEERTAILATSIKNEAIDPCTGVIVDGGAEGVTVGFYTESQEITATNNGSIQMVLAQQATNRGNASTLDNAIVSFNEGNELPKFYFGEQNANLYIPQGTEEYAIAYSNGQGEMPVNFRANENGQYTLTVNPENVEMNYLHLIDNMTGTDIDLLATPSYTFNAKTTDYESRFKLVFAANTAIEDNNNETFAFFANGQLIVSNEGEATLQVIDIMGRILNSETVNGSVSKAINQPAGIYMIRLINGNDVKVQKMIVR